jgi:hypothetical protein
MALDWQLDAEAVSVKGDVTDAPFVGLVTVMPSEDVLAADAAGSDPLVVAAVTSTVTSCTQTAPLVFHAFTWMVCVPAGAGMEALRPVLSTMVVSVLLSREYPMAVTGWLEQLSALATSEMGLCTWALLSGVVMVTASSEEVNTSGRSGATNRNLAMPNHSLAIGFLP